MPQSHASIRNALTYTTVFHHDHMLTVCKCCTHGVGTWYVSPRKKLTQATLSLSNFLLYNSKAACKEPSLFIWTAMVGSLLSVQGWAGWTNKFLMIQDSGCLLLPANCAIKGKFVSLVLGQPITVRLWQEVIDVSIWYRDVSVWYYDSNRVLHALRWSSIFSLFTR